MDYYSGFVFYLDEGNQKWKEYYDLLGKKSFGVFSVAQYFTKKLKELADDKLDKVFNIESSYINQLSDNSLHLSEKAISNWKDIYSDLLQQGDVCVIAIPGYLWKGTPQTSYSFMTKVARKEVTLSDVLTIPEYAELVEKLFILRFGKKPQDCTTDTVEFFIPALQCAISEHFVMSDAKSSRQTANVNTLQAPEQPVIKEEKTCRCDKDLKIEDLRCLFTKATDDDLKAFVEAFNKYYKKFNINTCIRRCHFLAQIRQEAGAKLEISEGENLNYSAELLKSKDKGPFKYFKEHPDEAEKYGRTETHKANPEAIANRAYANRNGNGDITSGDGWRYRGGGYIQVTGKYNYEKVNEEVKRKCPEFTNKICGETVNKLPEALISAMAYWSWKKLNAKADTGYADKDVDAITNVINKDDGHKTDRKTYFETIKNNWKLTECNSLQAKEIT